MTVSAEFHDALELPTAELKVKESLRGLDWEIVYLRRLQCVGLDDQTSCCIRKSLFSENILCGISDANDYAFDH